MLVKENCLVRYVIESATKRKTAHNVTYAQNHCIMNVYPGKAGLPHFVVKFGRVPFKLTQSLILLFRQNLHFSENVE